MIESADESSHKKPKRINKDDYFFSICNTVSLRSTCLRRQVGAAIVGRRGEILTTGYNGPPRGVMHCEDRGGCIREKLNVPSGERHELCYASHAEQNAVAHAALNGVSLEGSTCYCTHMPCSGCIKSLINAGIKEVRYRQGYPDELTITLAGEAGVVLTMMGDR